MDFMSIRWANIHFLLCLRDEEKFEYFKQGNTLISFISTLHNLGCLHVLLGLGWFQKTLPSSLDNVTLALLK